jgi:hypothetical protein
MWKEIHPLSGQFSSRSDGRGKHGSNDRKSSLLGSTVSNASSLLAQRPTKRFMISSTAVLLVLAICNINTTSHSIRSIRRILCLDGADGPLSPYIDTSSGLLSKSSLLSKIKKPPVPARRPVPTHIQMCEAFLQRREFSLAGNQLEGTVHIVEDEAVCMDWSTPLSALYEIFSGAVINQVSQKYGVTYSHDCHKTPVPETGDGLDWKTIQQGFPPSGLVMDDESIDENQIVQLCKGCIAGFNHQEALTSVTENSPNPSWFHPHSTHHCIMYPGTSRPLINNEHELDLAALQQQRLRAQEAPLGQLSRTIGDRMRFSATKRSLESPASMGRSAGGFAGNDDAVVIVDGGSEAVDIAAISKEIPQSVKTITVLATVECTETVWENGENCIEYAETLRDGLKETHPTADDIKVDVVTSSNEANAVMTAAKYLVCPPGTNTCLIPAMSKSGETFASVLENSARSLPTNYFFDTLNDSETSIQISDLNDQASSRSGSITRSGALGRSDILTRDELADGLGAFESGPRESGEVADGCAETRSVSGNWEQDFRYEDLATGKNALLRGSSIEGMVTGMEEGQETRSNVQMGGFSELSRAWSADNPECALDNLTVEGLCEVVNVMQLGVVQFVGDKYTEDQVRSFWNMLGIDDGESGEVFPSTTDPKVYRKTVHCPVEEISFDIVFTPNDKITGEEGTVNPIEPYAAPVHNYSGVNYVNGWNDNGGVRTGSCWTNPYGAGCGCNLCATHAAAPPPVPPAPQYNNACGCIPFGQQHQYNYAVTAQPYQQPTVVQHFVSPGVVTQGAALPYPYASTNQFIVAGITPQQSLPNYVNNVNQLSQTITNTVNPNDVVVLRTGALMPEAYGGVRRTQENDFMNEAEMKEANRHLHRSIDEYKRRTRQNNVFSYDPAKSKMPLVHVLDVTHMTHSHPLSKESEGGKEHRNLENTPDLFAHWNHLLFTNMRDMARAQLARNSAANKSKQESAPPGSPYHNAVPMFP